MIDWLIIKFYLVFAWNKGWEISSRFTSEWSVLRLTLDISQISIVLYAEQFIRKPGQRAFQWATWQVIALQTDKAPVSNIRRSILKWTSNLFPTPYIEYDTRNRNDVLDLEII